MIDVAKSDKVSHKRLNIFFKLYCVSNTLHEYSILKKKRSERKGIAPEGTNTNETKGPMRGAAQIVLNSFLSQHRLFELFLPRPELRRKAENNCIVG